jgi:hypothetical protein
MNDTFDVGNVLKDDRHLSNDLVLDTIEVRNGMSCNQHDTNDVTNGSINKQLDTIEVKKRNRKSNVQSVNINGTFYRIFLSIDSIERSKRYGSQAAALG